MSEAKHTPGPWTIEEYGDDDAPALVIHKDSETRICFLATPGSHGDPEKIEADANLIAAAPEMLEALRIARKWMPVLPIEEAAKRECALVDAAIAKATGAIRAHTAGQST